MVKETKHHRDERKKPSLTPKERRAKKHEKKLQKLQKYHIEEIVE